MKSNNIEDQISDDSNEINVKLCKIEIGLGLYLSCRYYEIMHRETQFAHL